MSVKSKVAICVSLNSYDLIYIYMKIHSDKKKTQDFQRMISFEKYSPTLIISVFKPLLGCISF